MAVFATQRLYIGGAYVDATSGETFDTLDPATGETLASVQQASAADVDRAVRSAQRRPTRVGRADRDAALAHSAPRGGLLRERNDELAALETRDTGKPIAETLAVDIVTGADVIEYYAGLATAIEGQQIPLRPTSFVYTRREPLGVCAGIGAWNYPIQIACWKSAPALAAGNAMIFKPSEITPLIGAEARRDLYRSRRARWRVQRRARRRTRRRDARRASGHREDVVHRRRGDGQEGDVDGGRFVAERSDDGTRRQVAAARIRRRQSRTRRRHRDERQLLQLRPGLHERHARVRATRRARTLRGARAGTRQAHSRRLAHRRRAPTSARSSSAAQLHKVLGYIESGKQEGARLIAGGKRLTEDDFAQRPVRRADRVHRLPRRHAHRARGNLRPGDEHPRFRRRRRSHRPRQRHRLTASLRAS